MRRNPLDDIDPAVASILGDAERKQRIRRLPREKQDRARRQSQRPRVMLDIPEPVQEEITRIAQKEGLSVSATAALLLADAVRRYHSGAVSFSGTKRISRSPRYEWALKEGVIDDVLTGRIGLTEDAGKLWK